MSASVASVYSSVMMNWRAYRRLIRWPVLLLNLFNLINGFTIPAFIVGARLASQGANLIEAMGGHLLQSPSAWPGARVFATFAVGVPAMLGFSLALIVRAPLCSRFILLLPGARRQLLGCHAVVLALAALGCATVARHNDPAVPAFTVFGFACAALAFSLPQGKPRARQAQIATTAAFVLGLLACWFAPELRHWSQHLPALASLATLGLAAVYFRASFSVRTFRASNEDFFVPGAGEFLANTAAAQRGLEQERWRAPKFHGRDWRHGPVGDSATRWLLALWHERYGAYQLRRLALAGLWLATMAVVIPPFVIRGLGQESISTRELASVVYSLICEPATAGNGVGYFLGFMTALFFLIGALLMPLPRENHVYVLSRDRRARLAQHSALAHTGLLLLGFTAVGLLAAWFAALIAGVSFQPAGTPLFLRAMLGALPFLPLWQWYGLAESTRHPLIGKAAAVVGLIAAMTLAVIVSVAPGSFLARLPWIALAVAASQWVYLVALRRLFRTVDLTAAATNSA